METELKKSEKDFVTLVLKDGNIETSIKYYKQSTLKDRIRVLEKLVEWAKNV